MYTGEEFFDMWIRPFYQHFGQQCVAAVSTFDAPENVPKEKLQTLHSISCLTELKTSKTASQSNHEITF